MLQNTEEEPIELETIQTAPAAHTRYLSSPADATLHGKIQGFVLRLPPQRKPMQHSCSHYNAFYSMTWLTRMHLRTWQHQMTTIMQPCQCDLQLQIQETHRTTHTGTTTRCRTQRRNRLNSKRSKPHPPHTRGTFHRRLKHFTRKNTRFRAPASSPKEDHATFMQPLQCVLQHDVADPPASTHMATPHDNNHAAIPMRSAATDSRNA